MWIYPQITKNFVNLGLVRLLNMSVPVIIIPVIINRIGLERYGKLALAQGIMMIFLSITDFGFGNTAIRTIGRANDNNEKISYALSVLQSSMIRIPGAFLLLFLLIQLVPTWKHNSVLILLSFALVIGRISFPGWYFVGIEKNHKVLGLNLISRTVYVVSVLILVKEPGDFLIINVLNGISWMIIGIIAWAMILRKQKIGFVHSWLEIIGFTWNNRLIFAANFAENAYRNGSIIIAGFLFGGHELGLFGIIDKIMGLSLAPFVSLSSSILPKCSELAKNGKNALNEFLRNFLVPVFYIVVLLALFNAIYGGKIVAFFLNDLDENTLKPFMYFVSVYLILVFINVPISVTLFVLDLRRQFLIYSLLGLFAVVIFGLLLGHIFVIKGLLMAILITEVTMIVYGYSALSIRRK